MRICAYAHRFSEKDFLPKNAFSPEGEFLPKTLVVLYCVISINNCMRMCAYAHMRTGTRDIGFFCLHNFSCEVGSCCLVVFGSFFPGDSPDVFFAYGDTGSPSAELSFMFAYEELFYCPAQVFGAVLCESVFDEVVNYCADCFAEAYGLQFAFFCVPGGVFREFFFWFLRLFSVFKCEKVNSDLFGYGFSVEVGAGFCGSDSDEAVSYPDGAAFHAEFDDFVGDHLRLFLLVVSAVPL